MSRIVLGDCPSVLPTLPDRCVDLAVTDLPYLVNYVDRSGRRIANDRRDEWLAPAFAQIFRVLRDDAFCISFYGWNRVDRFFEAWRAAGFRAVGHIVFAKSYPSQARFLSYRHEAAYLLAKGQPPVSASPLPDVMPWTYSGNYHHPTQKPVECLEPLIETFSKPRDIVLDPFVVSGSTCVAARQSGRRFYGIEIDPKYHAAAILDSLLHHSHVITIRGDSYRLRTKRRAGLVNHASANTAIQRIDQQPGGQLSMSPGGGGSWCRLTSTTALHPTMPAWVLRTLRHTAFLE